MTCDLRPATLVKICGVRTPEQALVAAEAGADLVGLVFYPPSHRCVTPAEAAAVTRALRGAGARTAAVGLFVNEPPARINAVVAEAGLDVVQLSGDEPAAVMREIAAPLLRAVRVAAGDDPEEVEARLVADEEAAAGRPAGPLGRPLTFLLDAHVPGRYGGTGTPADWELAARLAARFPVLLAGGLTAENVGEAIRAVLPLGVDVSSGVETNRVKDPAKIRRFVAAARAVDRRDRLWRGPATTTERAAR